VCFHLEGVIHLSPVLKCKIHCTRAKIRSTDTDLYYGSELLTLLIDNFTCMNLISELSDTLLLLHIEFTLVDTVSNNIVAQLSTG